MKKLRNKNKLFCCYVKSLLYVVVWRIILKGDKSFFILITPYREQLEVNHVNAEKLNKKDAKKQREQEKKEQMERQKKQNELKKNFQVRNICPP